MNRNSQKLKDLLIGIIRKQKQDLTGLVSDPQVDFSRNRKLPYENMILSLLTMEGATLANELLRQFGCSATTATSSAFVQQRKKILPTALESLFRDFSLQTSQEDNYKGYKLLAVDGSDIQIPTNLNDEDSLFITKEGVKPYNLLHLNFLYNLLTHTYEDAMVFKRKEAFENKALTEMVEYIIQEIFASLIMYNFSELITSHVVIEKGTKKYEYKVNFSVAVHICRDFLLKENIPPDIESLIARYITPIRPGRSRPREMKVKQAISFMYRVA